MVLGALALSNRSGRLATSPEVWVVYPLDPAPGRHWVLVAWVVLGLVGVFIQLKFTGNSVMKLKSKK